MQPKKKKATCSKSHVWGILTSNSPVLFQPHAQALRDSPSFHSQPACRAALTHFTAMVTAEMCHTPCKHFSRWFQPYITQQDSSARVQKVTARNWTLTAGWPLLENPKPERQLLLHTSDNNLKLLIKLNTIPQPWAWECAEWKDFNTFMNDFLLLQVFLVFQLVKSGET